MATIDWSDPCAAYEALNASYMALLAGQRVEITEFEVGSGTRRKVQFARANAVLIQQELARLAMACRRKRGLGGRSAIRGG